MTMTRRRALAWTSIQLALVFASLTARAEAGSGAQAAEVPELAYLPADLVAVAYVDIEQYMRSSLRLRLQSRQPTGSEAMRRIKERTGVDFETDVDAVLIGALPHAGATAAVALARGSFDEARLESYALGRGGVGETYQGVALIWRQDGNSSSALAFLAPGLIATGETVAVRRVVDCRRGADNLTENAAVMRRIRGLAAGASAWAVGRLDRLPQRVTLPEGLSTQLSAVEWLTVSADLTGSVSGSLRAETRDEGSAGSLRDALRGFLAGAGQQAAGRPELEAVLESIELGGTGNTVALSFSVPAELLDSPASSD